MKFAFKLVLFLYVATYFVTSGYSAAETSLDKGAQMGCPSGVAMSYSGGRGQRQWACVAPPKQTDSAPAASDSSDKKATVAPGQRKKSTQSAAKKRAPPAAAKKGEGDKSEDAGSSDTSEIAGPVSGTGASDDSGPCEVSDCPPGGTPWTTCTLTDDPNSWDKNKFDVHVLEVVAGDPVQSKVCVRPKESSAEGSSCYSQFLQSADLCIKKGTDAHTDCDEENETIQAAGNAAKAAGAGATVSVELACSKVGEISKIANSGFSAWRSACALSQFSCESSCSDAKTRFDTVGCIPPQRDSDANERMDDIKKITSQCQGYKQKISEAAQHALAAVAQMQAAKKCKEDTSALTTENVDECKKNPNNPLCTDAQKCSNATFAASNKVCQCINNPNSKDCITNNGLAGSRGVSGATIPGVGSGKNTDPAAAFIPPSSGSGTDAFANSLQNGAVRNEQNLGGAKGNAGLGGGTGGPGGGGGSGLGSNSAAGGGAPGEDKSKINSGFYGGGTAGGGYFGKPGGANGSGKPSSGGVNYNKLGAGGAQFDPRRYIAGLNGKMGEYINGPNMDIFRIVKNRIESKKPSMLDPDYKK
jgi:hypothetical protein